MFERDAVQGINEILTIGDGFTISDRVAIDDIGVVFEVITDNFFDAALERASNDAGSCKKIAERHL